MMFVTDFTDAAQAQGGKPPMRPRRLGAALLALALGIVAVPAGIAAPAAGDWGPLEVLGRSVPPGTSLRMPFLTTPSFAGNFLDTLVVVTRGSRPGPTLCVIAGIHGDEVNGVEIARRIYARIPPEGLSGTLLVAPAVNVQGFRTGSRNLADRRDLNRAFPGSPAGSHASLIAHALFAEVRRHCSALVDLHTGSNSRTNLPQIRTDIGNARALALAESFGVGVVIDGRGPEGSLRRAAMDAGIPAVIYEAGRPLQLEEHEIAQGVRGVQNVMVGLGMLPADGYGTPGRCRTIRSSGWVRVRGGGGMFLTDLQPGAEVQSGQALGTVTDPITDAVEVVRAQRDGLLIGMAVPQVVLTGFALFHIGG
jgi:predicted deacylase